MMVAASALTSWRKRWAFVADGTLPDGLTETRFGLRYYFKEWETTFEVIDLRRKSGELWGEMTVRCNIEGARGQLDGDRLRQGAMNFSSLTARTSWAKALEVMVPSEVNHRMSWGNLLERVCQAVLDQQQQGSIHGGQILGTRTGPAGRPWAAYPIIPANEVSTFYSRGGAGKALALETPLPTPSGWTTMGEVEVGDALLDEQGQPCRVVGTSPIQYGRKCYRVRFSDGSSIVADAEHRWMTEDGHSRAYEVSTGTYAKKPGEHRGAKRRRYPKVRTTAEIAATLRVHRRGDLNHAIRSTLALNLPDVDLPIDPWVLGLWLGDGTTTDGIITAGPEDVAEVRSRVEAAGYTTTERRVSGGRAPCFGIRGFRVALRDLGVLGNKHVPRSYLRSSTEQRLALLRGLMDSDGWAQNGSGHFASTEPRLTDAVHELAVSLGWKVRRRERPVLTGRPGHRVAYEAAFRPLVSPFLLRRKAERLGLGTPQVMRHLRRMIRAVEPVPSVPVKCVAVDSPSHLYLAGRDMVPTHNTSILATLAYSMALGHTLIPGIRIDRPYRVAILDWETNQQTADDLFGLISETHRVRIPDGLWYEPMESPIERSLPKVASVLDKARADLVIIDSVGMALLSSGEFSDPAEGITRVYQSLRRLGTWGVLIDHVTGNDLRGKRVAMKAYGSIYRMNLARHAIALHISDRSGESANAYLACVKSNVLRDSWAMAGTVIRSDTELRWAFPDGMDYDLYDRLMGPEEETPPPAEMLGQAAQGQKAKVLALLREAPNGVGTPAIAAATGINLNVCGVVCDRLEGEGLVQHRKRGSTNVWYLAESLPSVLDDLLDLKG